MRNACNAKRKAQWSASEQELAANAGDKRSRDEMSDRNGGMGARMNASVSAVAGAQRTGEDTGKGRARGRVEGGGEGG